MSEAFIFSILLLAICIYGVLSTFLNWESSKKSWAKKKPYTVFDRVLVIVLLLISICFVIFVLIKGY